MTTGDVWADPLCDCTESEIRDIYASALPQDRGRLLDRLEACERARQARLPLGQLAAGMIGAGYIPRPHTDLLMTALTRAVERADRGEDTKLIISMPPGSGKSSTASVAFPLWLLLNRPDWEIGLISAEASLAEKFSRTIRDHYDERCLRPARGGVQEWQVAGRGGGVIARGIAGSIVGRRLRVAIIDDPIRHMSDAYSETVRERVWNTWQGVIKTRMRPGSIVLSIATRWHDDDLNGRLITAGGWDTIVIPALAEEDDPLGRATGEPLLSVQKHETAEQAAAAYESTKLEVGSAVFNAQYQQHPGQLNGTVYKLEWWRYYALADLPAPDQIITAWDLSFGDEGQKQSDWCVGQAWQRTGSQYFLLDQVRFRGEFTEQIKRMKAFIARHPAAMAHVIEKAANGAAAISTLRKSISGIIAVPPEGSKVVRAEAVSPLAEAHQVFLPEGVSWVDDFVYEHTAFPTGRHDDQVDASSYGLRRLRAWDVGPAEVMTDRPRLP